MLPSAGDPFQRQQQIHATELAAHTQHEAAEVFELIKGNFLLSQVFFELAREVPIAADPAVT